jgi:hypothetical protein
MSRVVLLVVALAACPKPTPPEPPYEPPPAPVDETPTPSEEVGAPRLRPTSPPGCGCTVLAPEGFEWPDPELSEDGQKVWASEAEVPGGFLFGLVAVRFDPPFTEDSPDDLEEVLISYLDFLSNNLDIEGTVGVGRGHASPRDPSLRGVIDFWEGFDDSQWAVKGWIGPKGLAVAYVTGDREYPHYNVEQAFFDSYKPE